MTFTIWDNEGKYCTFYTVQLEDSSLSETDKFFDRYGVKGAAHDESAMIILRLITQAMGDENGATDDFFTRGENAAYALPPKLTKRNDAPWQIREIGPNFPLRLFCYRISESIVVLFNGGIKDAQSAQDAQLSMHFNNAQLFTKKIVKALKDGMIRITDNEMYLESYDGSDELIL